MKTHGEVEVQLHAFLTSALDGGEWSASRPGRFARGANCKGGCVGPRAGVDAVAKKITITFIAPDGNRTLVFEPVA
jgi:hypothetical protein